MHLYLLWVIAAVSFLNLHLSNGRSLDVSFPKKLMGELLSKPGVGIKGLLNAELTLHLEDDRHNIERRQSLLDDENKYPGSCFAWGGSHFKTFDGELYSFTSTCAHTLLQDVVGNTLKIVIQNSPECPNSFENCYTITKIYLEGFEYVLKRTAEGEPVFMAGDRVIPIPGGVPGIRTEKSVQDITVNLESVGVRIKWDRQQLVQVEIAESLQRKTTGLCGTFDDDPSNDILMSDGSQPQSIVDLAQSWQANTVAEECKDVAVDEHTCQDSSKGSQAIEFCNKLLFDRRFFPCRRVMDIRLLLDICLWDYCSCANPNPKECVCDTLNMYVRECTHKGITALSNWREDHNCPVRCTGGRVYMKCGPARGQDTCGGASQWLGWEIPCEEGCFCPEGKLAHNSKCIPKEQCPCTHEGKEYPPGANIPKECNTCTCTNGDWDCTKKKCCKRCSAVGDPHFTTFDGKRYDFQGRCAYTLFLHRRFTIEIQNKICGNPAILPTCVDTVTIKISGQVIELKQKQEITVNGEDVTNLPFYLPGAVIRAPSSSNLIVELPNEIEVWWDGIWTLHVDVPEAYTGQTKGLCGTFNGNPDDDFLTPEGDIEQSPVVFADKWKVIEKCSGTPDTKEQQNPCDANAQNKANAEKHCGVIKSKLFADCHKLSDPEPFYQDCMFDMCACDGQIALCLCPLVGMYAKECARLGVHVDWRNEVRECGLQCPSGQKYQICGNSCTRSCTDIGTQTDCKEQCVEGCNCPPGQTLNENGECILIRHCNCQYNGVNFPAGHKYIRTVNKINELCACTNARWSCRPATPDEIDQYFNVNTCDPAENKQYIPCKPAEPRTCNNVHSVEPATTTCVAGCQCKPGYVFDGTGKTCIKPTECPCYHGGQSYGTNSVIRKACNTCTCKDDGKWECTQIVCPGECSAWGNSHYKTFDNKLYDYQGLCDYVLAKSTTDDKSSFNISVEKVQCSALGTSCLKSITVRIETLTDQESITLRRDKNVPAYITLKQLNVRQKGHFIFIEAPNLKFVVRWDQGTQIYVKLDAVWKNQVKGLCGNYNDNPLDDFLTPDGKVETSVQLFGDSWRLQPLCPKAVDITNTCAQRPERRAWAVKQCGILKSSVFADCHSDVPVEIYFQRCVFDTCACDLGGDFDCLCTALAAYAQECNHRGIPIKWRTSTLCPMQCDEECAHYNPCISTCPVETCDNTLIQGPHEKICEQETCVEGCEVNPCPVDHVYLNSSTLQCVQRSVCKPARLIT